MRYLDLSTWPRKAHFDFFRAFDEPFFGVTVELDCTELFRRSRESGESFFLRYLHASLVAANDTEAFRYRIEGERVVVHDEVHASATIDRDDGTFGFSYLPFHRSFQAFAAAALPVIAEVRSGRTLTPAVKSENVIHYSSLPWLRFTALSHARHYGFADSSPKMTFGRLAERDGRQTLPFSIHVHHALMDGRELGLFVEAVEHVMKG